MRFILRLWIWISKCSTFGAIHFILIFSDLSRKWKLLSQDETIFPSITRTVSTILGYRVNRHTWCLFGSLCLSFLLLISWWSILEWFLLAGTSFCLARCWLFFREYWLCGLIYCLWSILDHFKRSLLEANTERQRWDLNKNFKARVCNLI